MSCNINVLLKIDSKKIMHLNTLNFRKLSHFKQNKSVPEESDLLEDMRSQLKIAEQALNALDEANRRFEIQFEVWRKDWRAKLGTLDMRRAELAVFGGALNDSNEASIDSTEDNIETKVEEIEIMKHSVESDEQLTNYSHYMQAETATSVASNYLPYDFEHL